VSRTVRGGKREAERVAAELTLRRGGAAGKVTASELLDLWMEQHTPTCSQSTVANHKSRMARVKADPIAKVRLDRLSAVDVERRHALSHPCFLRGVPTLEPSYKALDRSRWNAAMVTSSLPPKNHGPAGLPGGRDRRRGPGGHRARMGRQGDSVN
jgi:hypothetical protein